MNGQELPGILNILLTELCNHAAMLELVSRQGKGQGTRIIRTGLTLKSDHGKLYSHS